MCCRRRNRLILPKTEFDPAGSTPHLPYHGQRLYRVDAAASAASTVYVKKRREFALDIMTPSDVSFHDVERGKVDLVINRFDSLPQSFHQVHLWDDSFSCVLSAANPIISHWNLDSYLSSKHVWVSKTGMGVGVGMTPR